MVVYDYRDVASRLFRGSAAKVTCINTQYIGGQTACDPRTVFAQRSFLESFGAKMLFLASRILEVNNVHAH